MKMPCEEANTILLFQPATLCPSMQPTFRNGSSTMSEPGGGVVPRSRSTVLAWKIRMALRVEATMTIGPVVSHQPYVRSQVVGSPAALKKSLLAWVLSEPPTTMWSLKTVRLVEPEGPDERAPVVPSDFNQRICPRLFGLGNSR